MIDGEPDGIETVEQDEFELLDDETEWMNIDLPEETVMNDSDSRKFVNFQSKLKALRLEDCEGCCERDFSMDIRNGLCSRCRADRGDPVRNRNLNKDP